MRDILKELNEKTGNLGSMVVTPDGIMVAGVIDTDLEEDTVAAFASSLLIVLKRNLAKLGATSALNHCTLRASKGTVMFVDMQNSYLIVVANTGVRLDPQASAIQQAIYKIKNRRVA